ncbi:hypothetical protein ACQP2F_03925 [Actinoplanes sp. CA-030573]|uniref:hypothetical protein n=1 Tax=Actinoplanes sp. CA-030573 TaxID=3239898 RepID=UPI003D8CADB6
MAFRTSAKLLGVTLGVAALAGASQLGLAYGLGIVAPNRALDITMRDHWTAELAWVAWFAMTSAVVGGMAGRPHLPKGSGAGTRLVTATAAGLGAAVVVPLTMQPARGAIVAGVQPVLVIGIGAALGAAAGIFAAYAALSRQVARWSLTAVGVAIWALAVLSVAPSMAPGKTLPWVRLGVLDAGFLSSSVTQRTALFTMPALALVSGVAIGFAARRRGMSTLTIALAGLAGPALLTTAYLIAGPGSGPGRFQAVPYWAAMTAAGAGVLGSVLAAVLRTGPSTGPSSGSSSGSSTGPGSAPGAEPTPHRPPLPKRDARPASAIAQAASAAAQRPEEQLRPSDTGVFSMPDAPSFDGFTPPQQQQHQPTATATAQVPGQPQRGRGRRGNQADEVTEWVSGLGNG